jgi:hypothetical protein
MRDDARSPAWKMFTFVMVSARFPRGVAASHSGLVNIVILRLMPLTQVCAELGTGLSANQKFVQILFQMKHHLGHH